jgi:hypothetical protein
MQEEIPFKYNATTGIIAIHFAMLQACSMAQLAVEVSDVVVVPC